jgi:hypothetical protein
MRSKWFQVCSQFKPPPHHSNFSWDPDPNTNTSGDFRRKDFAQIWRPYVACNLHFYTTLLVLFLRFVFFPLPSSLLLIFSSSGITKRKLIGNINTLFALEATIQVRFFCLSSLCLFLMAANRSTLLLLSMRSMHSPSVTSLS